MQGKIVANQEHLPDCAILEVRSNLDSACSQAIVRQAKKSLQNGSESIVIDLSKRTGLSLLELAVLIDRANEAGVLEKVAFHLTDSAIRRFFANMKRIRLTLRAKR